MSDGLAPSNADLFRPVAVGRISQAIVEQVRALIRTGELGIGARLPSERELGERFGVSRVTVREALRVLEASGLIEIRVGSRGGAFVTAPTTRRVGEGITDLLSLSALSAAEVTEAREVFELGIVPLVCERATEGELDELVQLCDEAERARDAGTYTVTMSFDFHLQVAAAAHNPALVMLMRSLREPVLMSLREAQHEGRQGVAEHRTFVEAVRTRDPDRAQRIMADHLQRTARRVAGH
ncbi:GntR family transcriptional regulator [Blastococcus colisei]|uniref:GntR family transcriptional regulator n=1 Tax=Blastococcus colisei TaxID=1564162 RepID=A0A543P9W8_9ACTN|nr:FadR/GntR family transcriptional regulator [Blastococcus colisei]TQN40883.1 GntR family transcriptional regulator [Blastococcus colisei]